ncbi:hypothetical protein Dsin_020532 [Dipteronia sinensis]|uniref:CCHC-type domain-containing protein n=1 Tax=Dipteronia sinensis TaxID=43782 RepID=A0AAE0E424_9ROSI|nr:hypothetical protein Dsin_020532 [Dipteronia sinensis]
MWENSGIPCKHAVAVFCFNRQFAHESVDWYYSREALKLTYSGCINPVPEEHLWHEFTEEEIIEPPKKHPKVGRPKKNRRREPDEEPARAKFSRRCTNCRSLGHNSRTCPKAAAKGVSAIYLSSKEHLKWYIQSKWAMSTRISDSQGVFSVVGSGDVSGSLVILLSCLHGQHAVWGLLLAKCY